jgi:hypothetical protein
MALRPTGSNVTFLTSGIVQLSTRFGRGAREGRAIVLEVPSRGKVKLAISALTAASDQFGRRHSLIEKENRHSKALSKYQCGPMWLVEAGNWR